LPVHFASVIAKAIEFAQQSQMYFLNDQDYNTAGLGGGGKSASAGGSGGPG